MGFIKKDGYTIDDIDITIPMAYAKISDVSIDEDGVARAIIDIQ